MSMSINVDVIRKSKTGNAERNKDDLSDEPRCHDFDLGTKSMSIDATVLCDLEFQPTL